ncbi:MAG TPA: hypothetical protein VGD72_03610 [Mycobacteriales bacterium]
MVLVWAALAVLTVPACSGGQKPAAAQSASTETQILDQYRKLWSETLPAAMSAAPGERKDILSTTLTDPELGNALDRLAAMDRRGRRAYGSDVPLRQTVTLTGATAVVTGCLDSSQSGIADSKTGRKLTRGVATNPVSVTFHRGKDGVWRASETRFPGTRTC